ncbi:MAG: alpha,alpha-trehalose-phosphate synthase (UDP-forming) [bacterium]
MSRLVVVSNRVALSSTKNRANQGGLAMALQAALKKYNGLWFGWSGRVTERPTEKVDTSKSHGVTVATVDLSHDEYEEYYNGFANKTLWPLCHYRIDLAAHERSFDESYHKVNAKFARSLGDMLSDDEVIWIHDYHLIPLGEELRRMGCTQRIGFFLHIPWPAHELLVTLPKHESLVRSLFVYDLVGLQSPSHVRALKEYIVEEAGGKIIDEETLECYGRTLRVKAYPIGIDAQEMVKAAEAAYAKDHISRISKTLHNRKLIIGVDRLDYSKGIRRRIRAYETLLQRYPENQGQIVLLQVAPPSRSEVEDYQDLRHGLDALIGRLNGQFSEYDWAPVRYVNRGYTRRTLAGLYRKASVALVTPLRDGMNLVSKEYVAAQDPKDPGVLILSRFAGAASQLRDALIVNPYDEMEMVDALQTALNMPKKERKSRWEKLMHEVTTYDVYRWRDEFVSDLTTCRAHSTKT